MVKPITYINLPAEAPLPTIPKIAVTAPAFCRSEILCGELQRLFPKIKFNEENRYLSRSDLIEFLQDVDGAVIGRDLIDESILGHLPRLKFIAKYGVGLDNIDQFALKKHGISFGWTVGVNKRSVAELTLEFMIGLCHNTFMNGLALKQGQWDKNGGRQLTGATVGIIGCGHVGKEVIGLLAPFHCRILVHDIIEQTEFCAATGAIEVSLKEVIAQAELLTLHVPLTELTEGMIDSKVFQQMRRTAYLINTSRGTVVRQDHLHAALRDGIIAGAALDVFVDEPPKDLEFLALPNLMVTPHIGGNTQEAVLAMGRSAIHHLTKYFNETSGN
jgi:D-3-phosphoglycerate dehydrogenase